jgi:hypothetical protein
MSARSNGGVPTGLNVVGRLLAVIVLWTTLAALVLAAVIRSL